MDIIQRLLPRGGKVTRPVLYRPAERALADQVLSSEASTGS
jgi:hypothetical protein